MFIQSHFNSIAENNLKQAHLLVQKSIEQHGDQLRGYVDILKNSEQIIEIRSLISIDSIEHINTLQKLSQPFYTEMTAQNGVNYLAFYDSQQHLLTGMKDTSVIKAAPPHQMLQHSAKSNGVVHGLMFDSDSILSLRVVYPWYIENRPVGFIEVGKKFSDIAAAVKQVFDATVFIGIRPQVAVGNEIDSLVFETFWNNYFEINTLNTFKPLSREAYKEFMEIMPQDSLRLSSALISSDTIDNYVGYVELMQQGLEPIPLGYIKNITSYVTSVNEFILLLIGIALVVCGIIYLLFWLYIKSIEKKLFLSHEELEDAKVSSDVANRAKTNFLTNMSHEIRTPLNAIIGFSQILLKRGRSNVLGPEDYQFIENINASGKNLNLLINDVLDLSKIEAGKAMVVERDFIIKEFISNLVSIYKPQAFKNRIEFVTYFDPDVPMSIKSDKGKINQVLINLIGNAIKYTPDGNKIEFSVLRESENTIAIKVVNEGVEIPIEKQKIIFDPFERINSAVNKSVRGTGLGLAITKNLLELLGGTILLSSENQRTEFTVIVPFKETVVTDKEFVLSEIEKVFIEDATIVIVEDNDMNVSIMKTFFEDYNYKIIIARNGEDGLTAIQESEPDLVLMDIQLPKMSGLQVVEEVRKEERFARLPIIAMSANAFMEHKNEAESSGMNDYITKPIDFDELMVVLEKYLYESKVEAKTPA